MDSTIAPLCLWIVLFSNFSFIAMNSIPEGTGAYTEAQYERLLETAILAFGAAVNASPPGFKVVIHTGNWGCGAYGGNKRVAALVQTAAAHFSLVDRLEYHAFEKGSAGEVEDGMRFFRRVCPSSIDVNYLVEAMKNEGFVWSKSDGNQV